MITDDDVRRAIAEGESETVAFMTPPISDPSLARAITSLANAKGGLLILGVARRNDVIGLSPEEERLESRRLDAVSDSILTDSGGGRSSGRLSIDGKRVLYLNVDAAPSHARPILTSRGDAFIRKNAEAVEIKARTKVIDGSHTLNVFVAMSFREEQDPALVDYWEAMRRAASRTNLPISIRRIDLKEGDYEISKEIMTEVDGADVVIADFTLSSHNVYFEIGYARGVGKRVIQTARKGTVLEFDVRNWRTIFYRNATELEAGLISSIEQAYVELFEHLPRKYHSEHGHA